jgi:hypothetical protein
MTPQEKAKELVKKFMSIDSDSEQFDGFKMGFFYAQRCALIAVDEILNNDVGYNAYDGVIGNDIWIDTEYWQEVKQEIEKL